MAASGVNQTFFNMLGSFLSPSSQTPTSPSNDQYAEEVIVPVEAEMPNVLDAAPLSHQVQDNGFQPQGTPQSTQMAASYSGQQQSPSHYQQQSPQGHYQQHAPPPTHYQQPPTQYQQQAPQFQHQQQLLPAQQQKVQVINHQQQHSSNSQQSTQRYQGGTPESATTKNVTPSGGDNFVSQINANFKSVASSMSRLDSTLSTLVDHFKDVANNLELVYAKLEKLEGMISSSYVKKTTVSAVGDDPHVRSSRVQQQQIPAPSKGIVAVQQSESQLALLMDNDLSNVNIGDGAVDADLLSYGTDSDARTSKSVDSTDPGSMF